MKAEYWALLTALSWSIGSLLEKQGIRLGNFTPVMGTAIRTAVSLIFLWTISFPYWGQLKNAGLKPILLIAIGGGLLAGGIGLICLYSGLKSGSLASVMTVAFCMTPVFGCLLGIFVLHEKITLLQLIGIGLCTSGAAMIIMQ